MGSILTDVKKAVGIGENDEHFDPEIILHTNAALNVLTQLGVGPEKGFSITDKTAQWADFLAEDEARMEMAKTYVCVKVKLVFDPPAAPSAVESLERLAKEYEWRLNVEAETLTKDQREEEA